MVLAILGAALVAAGVVVAFGVPWAGALVVLDLAAAGGLVGALLALAWARVRRRPLPVRTLATTALLATGGALHLTLAPHAPMVLLVVVDCLRADRLDPERMPATWELTRDAVSFTTARSQSSWTRSAMPSLLSGRYPVEHGLYRTRPAPDRIRDDLTLLAERLEAGGWLTAAFAEQAQLDAAFGYARGFGRYGWRDGHASRLNGGFTRWNRLFRSVPRFALLHYIDVHGPYTPKKRYVAKGAPVPGFPVRPSGPWRATIKAIRAGRVVPTPDDWAGLAALYDGQVRQYDRRMAGFWRRLREEGDLDHTLLVLTADHGERFGEQGDVEHMGAPDEAVLAVPLLIRPPGGTPARRVDTLVQHVDVAPTVLAFAGLPVPAELPGRDLGPALRGEPLVAGPAFAEEWYGKTHRVAVRDGDWKLTRTPEARLYDLASDPGESTDLAATRPEVVARLEGLLAAYFGAAAAGRPIAGVAWDAARASGARWVQEDRREAPVADVSDGTIEALEALGYLEEEPTEP